MDPGGDKNDQLCESGSSGTERKNVKPEGYSQEEEDDTEQQDEVEDDNTRSWNLKSNLGITDILANSFDHHDIVLRCEGDGRDIPANKLVLAASSPLLRYSIPTISETCQVSLNLIF